MCLLAVGGRAVAVGGGRGRQRRLVLNDSAEDDSTHSTRCGHTHRVLAVSSGSGSEEETGCEGGREKGGGKVKGEDGESEERLSAAVELRNEFQSLEVEADNLRRPGAGSAHSKLSKFEYTELRDTNHSPRSVRSAGCNGNGRRKKGVIDTNIYTHIIYIYTCTCTHTYNVHVHVHINIHTRHSQYLQVPAAQSWRSYLRKKPVTRVTSLTRMTSHSVRRAPSSPSSTRSLVRNSASSPAALRPRPLSWLLGDHMRTGTIW